MKYKKKNSYIPIQKYTFVCDFCGEKIHEQVLPPTWVAVFYKNLAYHICDICKHDPFVQKFLEVIHGYSFRENMINILKITQDIPELRIETPLLMGFLDEDFKSSERFIRKYLITHSVFGDSFKRR